MGLLQFGLQPWIAQLRGRQPRRALAAIAEGAAGIVQPVRVDGQHADAIAVLTVAGAVVDTLGAHQQDVAIPGQRALTAMGVALATVEHQPDVVLQVEMPRKGETAVLGVDETDAGQAAAVVFDAFHGPTLPAQERRVLDKIASARSSSQMQPQGAPL